MKEAQQNLGFHFGNNALNYRVTGYLEVANTWRYKGPTTIPFAVIDQYGRQVNHFQITPDTVKELFLAAKQAKYRPLALLASLQYDEDNNLVSHFSYPRSSEGFVLSKSMHPNPATPVFGMVNKTPVCLSSTPSDFAVVIKAPVPAQIKLPDSVGKDTFNVAVMMSPGTAAGFFCITPESIKRVFDLCRAHALDPVDLIAFVRTEDSFELKECNRFIVAHEEAEVNDGKPIYIAGFDIRGMLRTAKVDVPEPSKDTASIQMDTPPVFRSPTKLSLMKNASQGPRIMNRREIQQFKEATGGEH